MGSEPPGTSAHVKLTTPTRFMFNQFSRTSANEKPFNMQ